jgi:multicomponent Na+:H+ antiporter subunit F
MRVLFLVAAMVIGVLILVSLVQAARAESMLDRLLAIALTAANSLVLLVLIGFVFERPAFFGDVGLAYALLAFLFPVAFAKFLETEANRRSDTQGNRPPGPEPVDPPGRGGGATP